MMLMSRSLTSILDKIFCFRPRFALQVDVRAGISTST